MADLSIHIPDKTVRITIMALTAILLLGVFSKLWSSGVFRPKYELQMFIPDSEGLRVGAPVLLNGMTVGTVSRIEPVSNPADINHSIVVTLRIDKRSQGAIRSESVAHLTKNGLVGDHFVSIQRGIAGSPINSGGEIRFAPTKELTVTDFINLIGKRGDCQKEDQNSAGNKSRATIDKSRTAP